MTNITKADVIALGSNQKDWRLVLKDQAITTGLSDNYAAKAKGEPLFYFNSAGYIELGVSLGRADETVSSVATCDCDLPPNSIDLNSRAAAEGSPPWLSTVYSQNGE